MRNATKQLALAPKHTDVTYTASSTSRVPIACREVKKERQRRGCPSSLFSNAHFKQDHQARGLSLLSPLFLQASLSSTHTHPPHTHTPSTREPDASTSYATHMLLQSYEALKRTTRTGGRLLCCSSVAVSVAALLQHSEGRLGQEAERERPRARVSECVCERT